MNKQELKVVSVLWKGGGLDDVWIETDCFNQGGGGRHPWHLAFVVQTSFDNFWVAEFGVDGIPLPTNVSYARIDIDLLPFLDQVHKAVNEVRVEGLDVEKVTILGGKVAAHPPARYHYRCPSCYPKE